jgi:iron complex outermembrane receptor protein
MQLQGGPAAIAVGAQFMQERFEFNPSHEYQVGDIGGFGGNVLPVDRKRNVSSVFTEVSAPFWKPFEVDLGLRYDNYQGTGSTWNPKLSFRWNPAQSFLVRGSVGSGFRAPSLTDLYSPQGSSVTANGARDWLRCPNTQTGSPADCNNQFPTLTGGNPDLKPEKSLNRTLGAIWEPNRAFSASLDAFWIELKDSITIGGLNPAVILASPENMNTFSSYIIRGAPDGNPSGLGPITGIINTTSNLFKQYVSGYDVSVHVTPELPTGKLLLKLDGTYYNRFLLQNSDGSYTNQLDRALRAGGGVAPRWRHVFMGTYVLGPWDATLQQNFQKSYDDVGANLAPAGTPLRTVGVYETYDIQGAYNGIRNLRLQLGVKNIFDKDPPYTNEGGQFAAGYDITYADVRGRFVYGAFRWTFK